MNKDIQQYHYALGAKDATICDLLYAEICEAMPEAENKIWHRHPVWFLEGNPIVGYSKLKDCIRLLFWSGLSFEVPGLESEGSFKAAEKRYYEIADVKKTELRKWLKQSREVQWDYKNIVKRKGQLERLK